MPVSVIVGGQFGSEGKGKVALKTAVDRNARAVVRVGGTNSGHTAYDANGRRWALRQLPACVLAPNTVAILPPGALIDPEIFAAEVASLGLCPSRVFVSPLASVIMRQDKEAEEHSGLKNRLGSTGSGSGATLVRRLQRESQTILAEHCDALRPFLKNTGPYLRELLQKGARVVIEGSQGFGLSLLHGGHYPKATSRDTTAATFLGEAGLSPFDVDEITLVIRAFPIRVAGNSGELKGEMTWEAISKRAGLPPDYREFTTATGKIRRIGTFDASLVRSAIDANQPSKLVLNHFDYFDKGIRDGEYSEDAQRFLENSIEKAIGRRIDLVGTGPRELLDRSAIFAKQRYKRSA